MSLLGHYLESEKANMQVGHLRMICQGLLVKIIQRSRDTKGKGLGLVIMLTSPTPGAGVSRITNALADSLNRSGGELAISLDCGRLDSLRESLIVPGGAQRVSYSWNDLEQNIADSLDAFRLKYQYILIDCPSLRETQDAVRFAPLVDGIIIVVEANRTQKEQLLYTERTLEAAKGEILGHVLNKRTYVIPDWISQKMEAIGL
jgi:Mrp family chromosome partitioning ATPase